MGQSLPDIRYEQLKIEDVSVENIFTAKTTELDNDTFDEMFVDVMLLDDVSPHKVNVAKGTPKSDLSMMEESKSYSSEFSLLDNNLPSTTYQSVFTEDKQIVHEDDNNDRLNPSSLNIDVKTNDEIHDNPTVSLQKKEHDACLDSTNKHLKINKADKTVGKEMLTKNVKQEEKQNREKESEKKLKVPKFFKRSIKKK